MEYTELQSEAPWEMQKRPPPDWPSKGLVTFDQVSFSYSDDGQPVLHNLKATFRPQEKVRAASLPPLPVVFTIKAFRETSKKLL